MRRLTLKLVSAVKQLAAAIRSRLPRSGEMPGLEELLDRAGVPRFAPPELLEVARLAGLRLDGDDDDDEEDDDGDRDDDDDEEDEEDEEDERDEELGEAGKAALDKERKARRDAEKRAKEAEKKAKKFEDEQLSKEEKAEKRAREAEEKEATATRKVRRANLLTALAEELDLTGGKAKAAARLLDDVEYDDDDEPTNLKDAVTAAKAEYGEEMFTGAKPAASGKADQGAREGAKKQLSSTEGMTPEEIARAAEEGRLDDYLKKPKS